MKMPRDREQVAARRLEIGRRLVHEAKRRGLAVIFITHQVMHAMAVGDHFAVLIRGAVAADFKKGERSREEITDLMAGGASMASLEAEIEGHMSGG
jgi:simple sugar transport system ATP-binding protein